MNPLKKGLILAAIQVGIVASLGVKLVVDRARFPRAWAKVRTYDPNLPIRGRYLSLQLVVPLLAGEAGHFVTPAPGYNFPCTPEAKLIAVEGRLRATPTLGEQGVRLQGCLGLGQTEATMMQPVLFFLPEHAEDPFVTARGGELWAEVTVPKKGPPRPIRLAVKKGGTFTPLDIK